MRRSVLLAAILTLCLPGISWGDAHLLLNFKDSKDYPVPFWVAIREGWSELPTVHTHQLVTHYRIEGNPHLITLKPGNYLIAHFDLDQVKHSNPLRVRELDSFRITVHPDAVTYLGDFELHRSRVGVEFNSATIRQACNKFPETLTQYRVIITPNDGKTYAVHGACNEE